MHIGKLFKKLPAKYYSHKFKDLRIDSRKCKKNDIFFSIKGFKKDGNKFIKNAIKNKASYIALGAFFSTKTKHTKYRATIKILNWSKKTTKIPIVSIGGINNQNYKKLLLNKANFLAISSYIWKNKKYKPIEALKKIK